MEAIDDYPYPINDPQETGDIDQFDQTLIPLLRNSYPGQFELCVCSLRRFLVKRCGFVFQDSPPTPVWLSWGRAS